MKKIFRMAVVCALAGAALITGCTKDVSTQVEQLEKSVAELTTQVNNIQKLVDKGYIISKVEPTAEGVDIYYTDKDGKEQKTSVTNGKPGDKGDNGVGAVVKIVDGEWVIVSIDKDGKQTETKTGLKAEGKPGADGKPGNYWTYDPETMEWVEHSWKKEGDNWVAVETENRVAAFPEGYKPLVAVWEDDALILSNIEGYEGELRIDLRTALTSIVTIPQLYYGGIEAVKYARMSNRKITGYNHAANGLEDDEHHNIKITKYNAPVYSAQDYPISSRAHVDYYVNPSKYDIDNAEWALAGEDYEYLNVRAGWAPSIVEEDGELLIERMENNIVRVIYEIDNPNALNPEGNVSVMQLWAIDDVNDREEVHSDFAAIVPLRDSLKAIAFDEDKCDYVTNTACAYLPDDLELYPTALEAAENAPSVEVQYDEGPFSLDLFGVHLFNHDAADYDKVDRTSETAVSIEDLQADYPSLEFSFKLVEYTLGSEVTEENMFGDVESQPGYFIPCFANRVTGKPEVITPANSKDDQKGRSAIGRKPIVLVELKDTEKNNIILAGYFKIIIAEEVDDEVPGVQFDFDLYDFDDDDDLIKIACEPATRRTKWIDMSYIILEQGLNMPYKQFRNDYTWDNTTYIADGTRTSHDLEGNEVEVNDYTATNDYGTITYVEDTTYDPTLDQSAINDVFVVTVTRDQAIAIREDLGGEVTLWTGFDGPNDRYVYVGITVHVGDFAVLTGIDKKINDYWYDDVNDGIGEGINGEGDEAGVKMTVRKNVRVPDDWLRDGIKNDVTIYDSNLDKDWYLVEADGYAHPVFTTDPELDADKLHYDYIFSDLNEEIDVFGSSDLDANGKPEHLKWVVANNGKELRYSGNLVATLRNGIDDKGKPCTYLRYENTEMAKILLNKFSSKETELDKILYCKVSVKVYFEEDNTTRECVDDLGEYVYNVRFLRPVDFETASPRDLVDGMPTGSWISIGNLFSATDWQGFKIFGPSTSEDPADADYGHYVPCYFYDAFGTKRVEWYGYYGFQKFAIDVESAMTNLGIDDESDAPEDPEALKEFISKFELLRTVSQEYKLHVAKADDVDTPITDPVRIDEIDDTDPDHPFIKSLDEYVLYYWNRGQNVQQHYLLIPVTITYAWGDCTESVLVKVKRTSDFDPNDPWL